MVTDPGEVFRLGTAKAKENLAFRRYLSAHHVSDRPFQILASEVQTHMDCTQCANCCRHSEVEVSTDDVTRIAEFLGMSSEEVERLYTEHGNLKNDDGCVFLDGNLCTIYDARPKTCREFPHIREGEHSLGSRPESIARWVALCPILYNALEAYKHVLGYHGEHKPMAL